MAKQNRNTLKSYFSAGSMPDADMFGDLVESTINIKDDGFEKSDEYGFKISNAPEFSGLTSYFDEERPDVPVWELKFDGEYNNLAWMSAIPQKPRFDDSNEEISTGNVEVKPAICLSRTYQGLKVGIGTLQPRTQLEVDGGITTSQRRGSYGKSFKTLEANRDWKDITGDLTGGSAFEVVARAINSKTKQYAMLHAIAMHTPWKPKKDFWGWLGLRNRIRYTHTYHDLFRQKLKLRWLETSKGYRLQLRTNCHYGEDGALDLHITRLWSDEDEFTPDKEPAEGEGK